MNIVTTPAERLLAVLLAATLCGLVIAFVGVTPWVLGLTILLVLALLFSVYQFDYLHPTVAFVIPWLAIIGFSMVPISRNARQLQEGTYLLVLGVIFIWMIATVGAPIRGIVDARADNAISRPPPPIRKIGRMTIAFLMLYAVALLNVLVSGYIPLIELFLTGDSLYADFGIPSLYGLFFAYANALGCLAFYMYLRTRKRAHLLFFLSVILIHLLFVTRQHMLTLLIESVIIRCFVTKPIGRARLLLVFVVGLVALNFLGELRSGDIRATIHIADEYSWIPGAAAWLYAYSYFNVLNLENTMAISDAPYFDGTMLQTILPSIIRPEMAHSAVFEIQALNILSYIYPIYLDIGIFGVLIFTAGVGWLTANVYCRALAKRRFGAIASYSFFFYAAVLSFFTDFWLYLPVVFQVVFFTLFDRVFFTRPSFRED